jgi:hypothetical protein
VVDVCIGAELHPAHVIGIFPEVGLHVLVDFFLQIHAKSAIGADDFVGAHAGIWRNIPIGITNPDVSRIVMDSVVGTLDGGIREPMKESCVLGLLRRIGLGKGEREG